MPPKVRAGSTPKIFRLVIISQCVEFGSSSYNDGDYHGDPACEKFGTLRVSTSLGYGVGMTPIPSHGPDVLLC